MASPSNYRQAVGNTVNLGLADVWDLSKYRAPDCAPDVVSRGSLSNE